MNISDLKKPLDIREVDFRVQSISSKGWATLLAYKDARVDMKRLDEVCGPLWQKDFKMIEGKLYCGVGIKIGDEWVWKWDVGTESFADKEKGEASDAFKRACFNWGIGRELYNYPTIIVQLTPEEYTVEGTRGKQTNKLRLKDWKWELGTSVEGIITSLKATDRNGNIRYQFPRNGQQQPSTSQEVPSQQPINNAQQPMQQQQQPVAPASGTTGKPTLVVMVGKDFTKQWLNVVKAINARTISGVDEVKQHYIITPEVETKINQLLNY